MDEKKLILQPRLQLLANLVPLGTWLADIGTDHGYLPVWLKQNGRIAGAIAADMGQEPLQHARRTAEEYGVTDVEFRLCDGLQGLRADEADTIVIAGMGGQTIIHILSAAPWTNAPGRYTLLLQPMTKAGILRRWLVDNGYTFTEERLVWDKDFLYPVLVVTGGQHRPLTELEAEYGVLLENEPLFGAYTDIELRRLNKAIDGLCRSEKAESRHQAEHLSALCAELQHKREEWSKG